LIALILTLGSNFYGQAVEGVITGTVYDPSGEAIMPGVEVVVRGDRVNQKAVSDNAGSYRFHIPPGNYEISASQNNLYPLRRSSIHVVSGQTITINLYPSFQLRT